MSIKETVSDFVNEALEESDCYLVELVVSESKIKRKIGIFIDSDEGITIEQCSKFSRELGLKLEEVIEDAFTLEVSSPGADSPLKLERQYVKNIGRGIKVIKNDLSEIKGKLIAVEDSKITVLPEIKKKVKLEEVTIEIKEIKEAKVIISFK